MSPANIAYVITLFVISFCIDNAKGIRCFQCNSFENPACTDIEANDTTSPLLLNCEPRGNSQMFCRKIVQSVKAAPDFKRITRTCGWMIDEKRNGSFCRISDTDFKSETTCQCYGDGCNTGRALTPIFSGVSTLMLVILCKFGLS